MSKKRAYFPRNIPADIISSLPEKLGSFTSRVAQFQGTGSITHPVLLVAQCDRKPQCIIATAGTTALAAEVTHVHYKNKIRHVEKFNPVSVFIEYSKSKGAVDVNNNIRDNKINLHDVIKTPNWQHRVMAFAFAIAEANTYLAYRMYGKKNGACPDHLDFRRSVVSSLLLDDFTSPAINRIVRPPPIQHLLLKFKDIPGKSAIQRVCSRCQQDSASKPRNTGRKSRRYWTYCICDGSDGPACCYDCFIQHSTVN
ncbi:hypothetical protein BGZ82_002616 [Podila clonocystis]|nr:hypothetical protein BGZ82_002616 [Podila clonocystis]